METVLSISLIVAIVMWAGLSLATLFGKLVFGLLPFTKATPDQNTGNLEEGEDQENSREPEELALVA